MKKTVLCLLLLAALYQTYSQDEYNYQAELEKLVKIPNTPEAEAFTKYGDTPVTLYTGTPNISIPLYTITGKELTLPMVLTYDASGIKIEQQSSWVGLGWNLSVGGRISRIAGGFADDMITGGYLTIHDQATRGDIINYMAHSTSFNTSVDAENYFYFLKGVADNYIDSQPDIYSLNLPGINDYITIDLNTMEAKALNNPRIKVVYTMSVGSLTKWTVTNEDGTIYYFDLAEKTRSEGSDAVARGGIVREYNTSWVLTKIESPNKKDVITLDYTLTDFVLQPFPITGSHVINTIDPNNYPASVSTVDKQIDDFPLIYANSLFPTAISLNGQQVVSFNLESRYDDNYTTSSGLHKITIAEQGSDLIKTFRFNYGYFGAISVADASTKNSEDIRYRLESLNVTDNTETPVQTYSFEYYMDLPGKKSKSQDYMGYYNGVSNTVLYPSYTLNPGVNQTYFEGADRTPDLEYAKRGTLTKINYPTGGATTFDYELNSVDASNDPSEPTSTTQVVTYGDFSVSAGTTGDSYYCGSCCGDKYQTAPVVKTFFMEIGESGTYFIDYNSHNAMNGSEAYILFNTTISGPKGGPYTTEPGIIIPYEQIVDQTTCNINTTDWYSYIDVTSGSIALNLGFYQVTLVLDNSDPASSASLKVYRQEVVSTGGGNSSNIDKAGLRIKTITDYTKDNTVALEKNYNYTLGTSSTGRIVFNPVLAYLTGNTLHRLSSLSGNQPHIVYSSVMETRSDGSYTKYDFNYGPNGIINGDPQFSVNGYLNDISIGKENTIARYNNSGQTKQVIQNDYYQDIIFSGAGLTVGNQDSRKDLYILISPDANNQYRFSYVEGIFGGIGGNYVLQPPPECDDPGNTCIDRRIGPYNVLEPRNYLIQSKTGGLKSSVKETFSETGTVTETSAFTYDPAIGYLVREATTTASQDITVKKTSYYPQDFPGVAVYDSMVLNNRLTDMVQEDYFLGNTKKGTRKNNYQQIGSGFYPVAIEISKGDNTPEQRALFEYYDNGNLKEAYQADGTHTVYLWGYDNRYPIARLDNTTYAEVETALTTIGSGVQNLKTLANADKDHTKDLVNPDGSITYQGSEGVLREALESLRSQLPNARVTTYTYDPLVGVTSITDSKRQTAYYSYDTFNRLKEVRDYQGKLISDLSYHYKGQN